MPFSFFSTLTNLYKDLRRSRPLLLYAVQWTAVITVTVAVAAFVPEIAFVWAVSPSSPLTGACGEGYVALPLDEPPWEKICVPANVVGQSQVDVLIPPVFAVVVVVGSVCFTRAIGLWEDEEEEEE
ncbi:uncharacterized protein [Typha latifolia]|uniref:uncharacterized protein n=1 Tax=Typha latifolia TaxID=4733 RepID=UPI003C2B9916